MTLNFGYFGLEEESITQRKFEELSDKDKKFFHDSLPWILMIVDVGIVSRKTIPTIVDRLRYINKDLWEMPTQEQEKYLEKFIGFSANVLTLSHAAFKKKLCARADNNIRRFPFKDKECDRLVYEERDWCLLEITKDEDLPLLFNYGWRCQKARTEYHRRLANAKIPVLPEKEENHEQSSA